MRYKLFRIIATVVALAIAIFVALATEFDQMRPIYLMLLVLANTYFTVNAGADLVRKGQKWGWIFIFTVLLASGITFIILLIKAFG